MAVINGTENSDYRTGSDRDDRISGLGGNDQLFGNAGRDLIFGGVGNDTIDGGRDSDTLYGEAGRDVLVGGGARDFLDGGSGVDLALYSGRSSDYRISRITSDSYFVADLRRGIDDTDELKSVERLFFLGDGTTRFLAANKAPTAVNDFATLPEGNVFPVTGNVLLNDFEPDLDPFTLTAFRTGPQFGSGNSGTFGNFLAGQYGSLVLGSDGSYSYYIDNSKSAVNALNVGQSVTDVFTYTLTDSFGAIGQATLSIVVTGSNDGPVAENDVGRATSAVVDGEETIPGSNATGNVLTNDTDADSPILVVSSVRTGTENGTGMAGSVGVGLEGAYGTLTLNADGTYTYVVDNTDEAVSSLPAGSRLLDSFTYDVSDGSGGTDQATLSIRINRAGDPITVDPNTISVGVISYDSYGGLTTTLGNLAIFESVTRIEGYGTPTLVQLLQFDALVVTWNGQPNDSVGVGNVLADYVDAGGNLILTTFAGQIISDFGNYGRLETGGYLPWDDYLSNYAAATTNPLPDHALFDIEYDINSITDYYRDVVTPSADATVLGSWSDGAPLALLDGSSGITLLTFFPVADYGAISGDYVELVANSIIYSETYL